MALPFLWPYPTKRCSNSDWGDTLPGFLLIAGPVKITDMIQMLKCGFGGGQHL
jgi:hypothetical protein